MDIKTSCWKCYQRRFEWEALKFCILVSSKSSSQQFVLRENTEWGSVMSWFRLEECEQLLHGRAEPTRIWQTDIATSWGTLSFCSSLAGQSRLWILPFEGWDKFNSVSIKNSTSHLSTFTNSFTISDGGQEASSGLGLARTEVWAAFQQNWKSITVKEIHKDHSSVTEIRGCDYTFSYHAHILGMPQRDGRDLLGGGGKRAKQIKLARGMDSNDSASNLSHIIYLKRFEHLDKKNDAKFLDIFKVDTSIWGYI